MREETITQTPKERAPGAAIVGRLLLEMTQRVRRSRSLALMRDIERAPFASRQEVLENQFHLLSQLLAHAEAHVPYYRELFQSLGIRSRDMRSLDDLNKLPVLTKEIVRESGHKLVRDDVPLHSLLIHHSGGSTGVPITFYRDRSYIDASEAGTFRNLRQAGWEPGEMVAFFWGGNKRLDQMSRWQFELRQSMRRMYQFDPFHSGSVEMEGWLRRWPSLRPSVALGYASTIARFADYIETSGKRVASLRGVFTTAERLFPLQREVISRVFGCPVYDLYGSSEVQNIAAECSRGCMHINTDFVVLEVDSTKREVDKTVPFIVTSLRNWAMPFIRYQNEDQGGLIEDDCDCGNNFPLMCLNIARVTDNFVFPGGRVVHGEFFTHLMYGSEGIENFRFHQTAPESITLWIVPKPGNEAERARAVRAAVEQIKSLVPEREIKVEVRETDVIPLSSAGKHRFTQSDVSATMLGGR